MSEKEGKKKKEFHSHAPRNYQLPGGVWRYGRYSMSQKKRAYLKKRPKVPGKSTKRTHYKIVPVKGEKNGGTRLVLTRKSRKWYPTDDVPRKLRNRHTQKKPPKLRNSLTPGTVLILLAGRHEGKRVVFLKQLASGLLLVTGPYKINRVPLRRVDQTYVIATQTKVDISAIKLPDTLNDDYFKRKSTKEAKGKNTSIFQETDSRYMITSERKEDQKKVDSQLLPMIRKEECLRSYLRHKFSLSNGQYPHKMVF